MYWLKGYADEYVVYTHVSHTVLWGEPAVTENFPTDKN